MVPSLMAASVLACLIFLFFLPCFSMPCTPALPCNQSIQIRPPFYYRQDTATNPDCQSYFEIGCNENGPFLNWSSMVLTLESISYSTNIIRVQDPSLNSSLYGSGCDNLYFEFQTPVSDFTYKMYNSLNTSLPFVRCTGPNQIQSPPKLFEKDYNLRCSPRPPKNCLTPDDDSVASFELILLFENDGPEFSLKSASYSSHLVARPDCFANSTKVGKEKHNRTGIIIVLAMTGMVIIATVFFFALSKINRYRSLKKNKVQENIESIIKQHGSFAPKRYRYTELKKLTNYFSNELGKGGFGSVFKGNLQNGCPVAVKLLHNSSHTGEEFVNEVISIGRTSHVNIVDLLGFCIEKSNHALIYEYMPNGSLDKYIYSENPKLILGWEKLYEISVGVARGLEYLHRGCGTRIVHFDIKPNNILLDEEFCPKIADFGMAKLCSPKESIISLAEMRGTIGYIAPEVFSRSFGVVSTKSDVYSYGMMVLEMVGGRRNAKPSAENSSQAYFPHWIYDRLVEGAEIELCNVTIETEEIARKMALVGLWCTQTNPANRPTMSRVVEMFERNLYELEMPPKPYLSSPPHIMKASMCSSC